MTLTNSTVAGNGAGRFGGGIYSHGGVVSLTDSTLTGNFALVAGGGVSAIEVTAANTIVVGNRRENVSASDISGPVTTSNGHNLFGSDVSGSGPGDLENVSGQYVFARTARDPMAAWMPACSRPMAARPRPWPCSTTSANPALGRGEGIASITTDQRGEPRPSVNPDIGAFELEQSHATVVGTAGVKLLQGSSDSEALLGLAQAEVLHRAVAGMTCSTVARGRTGYMAAPGATP